MFADRSGYFILSRDSCIRYGVRYACKIYEITIQSLEHDLVWITNDDESKQGSLNCIISDCNANLCRNDLDYENNRFYFHNEIDNIDILLLLKVRYDYFR